MNQFTHKAKTIDGTWVEGWYDGSVEDALLWLNDKVRPFRAINPFTLCRSTYRPDRNGTLMYEGDEVEVNKSKFWIIWDDEYCAFKIINDDGEFFRMPKYYTYTLTGKNKHD